MPLPFCLSRTHLDGRAFFLFLNDDTVPLFQKRSPGWPVSSPRDPGWSKVNPNHKMIHSILKDLVHAKEEMTLAGSLGLRDKEVISLVGAGGKTTLMFRLAKELLGKGKKIVTTTTTKIAEPTREEAPCLFVDQDPTKILRWVTDHLEHDHHLTLASERLESGKLQGISTDLVVDLWGARSIDYLVIEADGAARRPVKAPREKEPVIASNTTLVVAILGLDGVEATLNEENVFQPERFSKIAGIPVGAKISPEAMARVMTHPEGLFKGIPPTARAIAFLNKADVDQGVKKGRKVAEKILEKKHPQIERVILAQLQLCPPVIDVMAS
jgi:probable selenium-dependent hydroxylase accessory protein YqeC